MAKNTYAILGATGHIGRVITEELLKKGHNVRAIGRDNKKLQQLKDKGAETITLSFDDTSALTQAFQDCDAVFTLLPPAINESDFSSYQDCVGEAIKNAISQNKIQYVVNLSSIGAHLTEGTGVIKLLARQENRLNRIPGLNVLHFRPVYFMENLNMSIPLIKNSGINGSTVRGDVPIPMVATRDVGLKIAEILDTLNIKGQQVFEFVGPRPITLNDATKIIGKAVNKPDLKYVQLSQSDAEKGLTSAGLKKSLITLLLEMENAFNQQKINTTQQITSNNKGKTTLEEFATNTFAKAYQQAPEYAGARR